MLIRLRRPWRARLAVTCAVLVLAAAGAALLLRDAAPPPFAPLPRLPPQHVPTVVTVLTRDEPDRETPPGPATLAGAVMLAVAGGLGVGGCLIRRRR
ncbi:hypothetical protein [Streptomyces sp. NPDC048650]|uniref:hypothetical protein n=1 Tax=unclassified Streptomyces TaxID=2593676 RepID=UPI0037183D01